VGRGVGITGEAPRPTGNRRRTKGTWCFFVCAHRPGFLAFVWAHASDPISNRTGGARPQRTGEREPTRAERYGNTLTGGITPEKEGEGTTGSTSRSTMAWAWEGGHGGMAGSGGGGPGDPRTAAYKVQQLAPTEPGGRQSNPLALAVSCPRPWDWPLLTTTAGLEQQLHPELGFKKR
jgi:hypothetical protein